MNENIKKDIENKEMYFPLVRRDGGNSRLIFSITKPNDDYSYSWSMYPIYLDRVEIETILNAIGKRITKWKRIRGREYTAFIKGKVWFVEKGKVNEYRKEFQAYTDNLLKEFIKEYDKRHKENLYKELMEVE